MNSLQNSKILITGGAGAIGSNLINYLQQNFTCEISVLDNLSAGSVNLNEFKNIKFNYLDISNTEKLNQFFSNYKPHFIFHLAAHFANQNSVDFPVSDIQTNVIGFVNILENQKQNNELKKVIYASSSCVYGNLENMNEEQNISPYDTPYAINKYVGELYAKYYSEIHNISTVCVRIFNSFGPGEFPGQYRNVIPNFIQLALQNKPIKITGTGQETRDFTFVENTVKLLTNLAQSKFKNADVFNGGTGNKTSIDYLAKTIIKLCHSKSEIIYTEARNWDYVKDRVSNTKKSKDLIQYDTNFEFEKCILETINWIKKNS